MIRGIIMRAGLLPRRRIASFRGDNYTSPSLMGQFIFEGDSYENHGDVPSVPSRAMGGVMERHMGERAS